ncbi:hypothetical protein [Cupriavidus sp. AU9028]|uniref:hypothetical protein n=1 Tax=Cupriavidus sp. AU9028 TaxID=2871157 RepID=UPI001C952609|nr:hypothetical protein [Cupriavidus sp. AU9028]MBY4897115.1 hypothetical protein [Cupriavidus sp. AU9028]
MQTEDDARTAAEKLRQLILKMGLADESIDPLVAGQDVEQKQRDAIDGAIAFAREKVIPKYAAANTILSHDGGRARRGFDFECNRLWQRGERFYLESLGRPMSPFADFLADPANANVRHDLHAALSRQLHEVGAPRLMQHEAPGDDLYLIVYDAMLSATSAQAIERMADTGRAPVDGWHGHFAVFGLILQARDAARQGNMELAYSFLLDANHLLGMQEGTRYVLDNVTEIAVKRRAKVNAARSRQFAEADKLRALELFYELRPRDEHGKPRRWKSAEAAAEKVWTRLVQEAGERGRNEPDIKDSTVLKVCQQLHRRDKKGSSLDIHVEAFSTDLDPDRAPEKAGD